MPTSSESGRERYGLSVSKGNVAGHLPIHKFGMNNAVGTTFTPIALGGFYRTPTSAATLEVVSSSADDNSAGTGARTVVIEGLDGFFEYVSQEVEMNGLTPVALPIPLIRVFRGRVKTSGSYATQSLGSHVGDIVVREIGTSDLWMEINQVTSFPRARSQVCCYTVPKGRSVYLSHVHVHVDSNKASDVIILIRRDANKVTAPFAPIEIVAELKGALNEVDLSFEQPEGPFEEYTDILMMAKVDTGTSSVTGDFEIIEIEHAKAAKLPAGE